MTWLHHDGIDHLHRRFSGLASETWCGLICDPAFVKEPKKPCSRCEDAAYNARKK